MADLDREQILRDNRRISIQMERWANASLAHQELTAAQAQILMYILNRSGQGTSLTAIHREFGGSMAALSSLVKRLKEKGYVRVEHCAGDDRRKLLFATDRAQQLREPLLRTTGQIRRQLYDCFSPEELATLDRLQKKLLHNLSVLNQQSQGGIETL